MQYKINIDINETISLIHFVYRYGFEYNIQVFGFFFKASLPKFDQEAMWDKLFGYIKMQKRLISQPYEGIPQNKLITTDTDTLEYNEVNTIF